MKSTYRVVSAYERVRALICSHAHEKIRKRKNDAQRKQQHKKKKKKKTEKKNNHFNINKNLYGSQRNKEGERKGEKMKQNSEFKKPCAWLKRYAYTYKN